MLDRRQLISAGLAAGGLAAAGTAGIGMLAAVAQRPSDRYGFPSGYRPQFLQVGSFLEAAGEHDTDYIPPGRRELNRDGSCVHHTTKNLLMALGLYAEAEEWRRLYSHGEYSQRHTARMEKMGLRFAVETGGDPRFLDWCCGNLGGATRGCGITLLAAHVVNLVDLDPEHYATPRGYVLNNWGHGDHHFAAHKAKPYQRDWLIKDWQRRGGWAFTVISNRDGDGAPYPPVPYDPPDSPYRR